MEVVADVVVVLSHHFEFEQERQILEAEIFKQVVEVAADKMLERQTIVLLAFAEIT